jgi:hypothetical protein
MSWSGVFLVIGTGRCGTVSVARLLDACENTFVSHENPALRSPWHETDELSVETFTTHARWAQQEGLLVGDVALYWLPHIDRMREVFPDLRVICLRRDKAATIASFERKCPGYTLVRPEDRMHRPDWWPLFPTIEAPTVREAWSRYYDLYYEQAARIEGALHIRTEHLSDDATLTRIFDFLEMPEEDRWYAEERRHNTSEETVIARSVLDR